MSLTQDDVLDIIEHYNIHLLNGIFLNFFLLMVVFGSLMQLLEPKLPASIRQWFRYGKHSLQQNRHKWVNRLEVPKSWFGHFYVFAFAYSLLALYLLLKCFITRTESPDYVMIFLDFMGGGKRRSATVDFPTALIATVLMTIQCGRRFVETNFMQVFSKRGRINLSHYMVGYIHYFGAITALLANTEGFVRGSLPSKFSITKISLLQYGAIILFHFAWKKQFEANKVFLRLRRDPKTGEVTNEKHFLVTGGIFEYISSPHMFYEIVMYFALFFLMHNSLTWGLIAVWVLSNQVVTALLVHKWYHENFKNYPPNRRAIFPYLL